jgi:hypothetical protein
MSAEALLRTCNSMRHEGADFPTIWRTAIKPHWMVTGIPRGDEAEGQAFLRIELLDGRQLVFRNEAFTLE